MTFHTPPSDPNLADHLASLTHGPTGFAVVAAAAVLVSAIFATWAVRQLF